MDGRPFVVRPGRIAGRLPGDRSWTLPGYPPSERSTSRPPYRVYMLEMYLGVSCPNSRQEIIPESPALLDPWEPYVDALHDGSFWGTFMEELPQLVYRADGPGG